MTLLQPIHQSWVAPPIQQPAPESFRIYAQPELAEATPWIAGVCFHPDCSQPFQSRREGQIYCCTDCKRAATLEMRKWGHKLALAALTRRMTKYEARDGAVINLTRAARRYTGSVTSAWLLDRQRRMARAGCVK